MNRKSPSPEHPFHPNEKRDYVHNYQQLEPEMIRQQRHHVLQHPRIPNTIMERVEARINHWMGVKIHATPVASHISQHSG